MFNVTREDIELFSKEGNRAVIGQAALMIAEKDLSLILMCADIGCRIAADKLYKKYPEKYIQTGIAEQTMISIASAMANEKFNVFAAAYAPFITARVLDQVRVNMGIMESPVTLIGVMAGLFASDLGPSSTACEDIAQIRSIPNIAVISPADCTETVKAMIALSDYNKPAYLRVTVGLPNQIVYKKDYNFEIGKAITLREGQNIAIISTGTITYQCLEAAEILDKQGISCTVLNMHTIKPLDTSAIDKLMNYDTIFTVEEHSIIGGLGGAVAEYLAEKKSTPRLKRIGTPDYYMDADSFAVMLERVGLSPEKIAEQILSEL